MLVEYARRVDALRYRDIYGSYYYHSQKSGGTGFRPWLLILSEHCARGRAKT